MPQAGVAPFVLQRRSQLAGGELFVLHHENVLKAVFGLQRAVDVLDKELIGLEVAGITEQDYQLINGVDEPEPAARGREVTIHALFAVADQIVAARQFEVRIWLGGVERAVGVVAGDKLPAVGDDGWLATLDVAADWRSVLQFVSGVEGDVAAVLAIVGQGQGLRLRQHGFGDGVDLLEGQLRPMVVIRTGRVRQHQWHAAQGGGKGGGQSVAEPEKRWGRVHGDLSSSE